MKQTPQQATRKRMDKALSGEIKVRERSRQAGLSNLNILAETVFCENKKMNAAKSAHDAARKTLLAMMEEQGIDGPISINATDVDGKPIMLVAVVETPSKDMISVTKLRELVKDDATFYKIVSATKKSVEEHVGTIVAVQATILTKGTTNVTVKPAGK
jgi:hypothetical protein